MMPKKASPSMRSVANSAARGLPFWDYVSFLSDTLDFNNYTQFGYCLFRLVHPKMLFLLNPMVSKSGFAYNCVQTKELCHVSTKGL